MPPLAEEDLTTIKDLINSTVNGANSNLKKLFELNIKKNSDELKTGIASLLEEKLSALKPADPPPDDGKGGKGGSGKDLQISTLQKQIADLQTSTATERTARIAAEKRRREIERTNTLDQHLAKGGVSDPFMRELALSYFDRRGYVPLGEDDDASLVWRGADGVDVNFEEGVTSWLKTEEAKRFLPPTGAGGSGGRPPPKRQPIDDKNKRGVTFEDVGNAVLGMMNPGLGGISSGE